MEKRFPEWLDGFVAEAGFTPDSVQASSQNKAVTNCLGARESGRREFHAVS
jgi:hypothetical protein